MVPTSHNLTFGLFPSEHGTLLVSQSVNMNSISNKIAGSYFLNNVRMYSFHKLIPSKTPSFVLVI